MVTKLKSLRAILIDAQNQEVKEVRNTGLKSLQKAVGGFIEQALTFDNGDILLVDEEGLRKDYPTGFSFKGAPTSYVGNGIIIGAPDAEGEEGPAKVSVEFVQKNVLFFRRDGK